MPIESIRRLAGASPENVTTGIPCPTARLIASVSLLASEQLTMMPSTPPSTSCSMKSACFWASSSFGVRQSMRIVMPSFWPSSRAASFAPARAASKNWLPCDLATMPRV